MCSGKVDVVSEAGLTCTFQQSKQRNSFISASFAPDDNNHSVMWVRACELQEVIPVAREEYTAGVLSKLKKRFRLRNRPGVLCGAR